MSKRKQRKLEQIEILKAEINNLERTVNEYNRKANLSQERYTKLEKERSALPEDSSEFLLLTEEMAITLSNLKCYNTLSNDTHKHLEELRYELGKLAN